MSRYELTELTSAGGLKTLVMHDRQGRSRAELIPERGALLTRFEVGGEPVLYLDPATLEDSSRNVRGGIPVLFPLAGKLPEDSFEVEGQAYRLKQHGFGRNLPWDVTCEGEEGDAAVVRCQLRSSPQTLAAFPWPFDASLCFSLQGPTLRVTLTVRNPGNRPMPLHFGLHPYFQVPQAAKAQASVRTGATRAFDNRGRTEGRFRGFDLTADEVDVHLLDHREAGTVLGRGPELSPVKLSWSPEFQVLVVWTLRGKDFVCVEPWTARGGALADWQKLPQVAPGSERDVWFEISTG